MFGELLASLDYFERKTIALIVRIAYSPNYISVSIRRFVTIISSVVSVLANRAANESIASAQC